MSVYDVPHQKLEKKVIDSGGYCCTLDSKDFWLRSMRNFSVTRFAKNIGIFEGRFIFIDLHKRLMELIKSQKVKSVLKLKKILLEMYKKENDCIKKQEIKKEFYSF